MLSVLDQMKLEARDYLTITELQRKKNDKYNKLISEVTQDIEIADIHVFDDEALGSAGVREALDDYQVRTINGFVDRGWKNLLKNRNSAYIELMIEFYATFVFKDYKDLYTRDVIKFRLGGEWHEMNLPKFGVVSGIYDYCDPDDEAYINFLRHSLVPPKKGDFSCTEAWQEISDFGDLMATDRKDCYLREPIGILLHRMMTSSIWHCNPNVNNKIPNKHMFEFHCLMTPDRALNLPYCMARMFHLRQQGEENISFGGHLITRLALGVNCFPTHTQEHFIRIVPFQKTKKDLAQIGVTKRVGDGYRLMTPGELVLLRQKRAKNPTGAQEDGSGPSQQNNATNFNMPPNSQGPMTMEMLCEFMQNGFNQINLNIDTKFNTLGRLVDNNHDHMVHLEHTMHCLRNPGPLPNRHPVHEYWHDLNNQGENDDGGGEDMHVDTEVVESAASSRSSLPRYQRRRV